MSNSKYKAFTDKFNSQLRTGEYSEENPSSGPSSHKGMNHDLGEGSSFWYVKEVRGKSVNWNSRAAENVATRAIIQYNNKIESNIE